MHLFYALFSCGFFHSAFALTEVYYMYILYRGYHTVARRYEYYFRVIKTIFDERAQRVSKILFLARENNIISSSHRVMFFLLYEQS